MLASALSHRVTGRLAIIDKNVPFLCNRGGSMKATAIRCASLKDDFQAVKDSPSSSFPTELSLPLASASEPSTSPNRGNGEKAPLQEDARPSDNENELFASSLEGLRKTTGVQLALYGGLIAGGLYLLESVLNAFEKFPLLPETLQLVGVIYAILLGSRLFQGKPMSLTPSPIKAMTELVDRKGSLLQRTNLELPQDLDARVLAKMEQLSRERDDAVNKLETLRRKVADYTRIVAEKEALEAVAVQLAQERDEAMSEVVALKKAVDGMSDRMRIVENALQQELQPLKQSSQALETVALQLASERDSALKELSELKDELTLAKCKEEERIALESLASQLACERDEAKQENRRLEEMLESLPAAGLSPQQEQFLKKRIDAAGFQFIDLSKQYHEQEEAVDKFVSHLVEEYGASSEWTLDYLQKILESSSFKAQEPLTAASHQEAESIIEE